MNYSLGNMLSRGGALNPDGLALDLQFAADKTLTARRGPTPTFTRASTATFIGSNGLIQSAAINAPRFDHDPVTLASRGLLIEESRTNLYSRSEAFEDSFWTKTRSSITTNVTTAPDGTLTADKLIEDTTAANTHTLSSSVTPTATPHTLSVFAKKGERTWLVLRLGGNNTFFNLDDGTIAAGSVNTPVITDFGNGWYRCSVTSSAGTQGFFLLATNSTTTTYTGDGVSGLFLWGAQLEAGSFPTSYIPTTTASVVRSADVCSITGSDFAGMWNASEGTMLARVRLSTAAAAANPFLLDFYNAILHEWGMRLFSNNFQVVQRDGSAKDINVAALSSQPFTFAAAYNSSNSAGSVYGLIASNEGLSLNNFTGVDIGRRVGGTPCNGHISSVRYYRTRLSNAQLQSLTT